MENILQVLTDDGLVIGIISKREILLVRFKYHHYQSFSSLHITFLHYYIREEEEAS
jgi:hypothetical protein